MTDKRAYNFTTILTRIVLSGDITTYMAEVLNAEHETAKHRLAEPSVIRARANKHYVTCMNLAGWLTSLTVNHVNGRCRGIVCKPLEFIPS